MDVTVWDRNYVRLPFPSSLDPRSQFTQHHLRDPPLPLPESDVYSACNRVLAVPTARFQCTWRAPLQCNWFVVSQVLLDKEKWNSILWLMMPH